MDDQESMHVAITDIDLPFMSIVWLMVKWAFASIPAMVIVFCVYLFIAMLFAIPASLLGRA